MQAIAPATSSPGRVGMMPATKPRTIIEVALPVTSEGLGGLDATIRAHGGHNGRGARPAIRLDSGAELHGAHGHRRVLSSGGDESSNSRRSTAVASTLVSARLAPLGHGQAPASAGGNGVVGQAYNGGSSTGSILTKPSVDPFNVRCCPPDQFVPDAHVLVCMAPGCGTSFSLFYRKHHCRMCGRIFCSACCSNIVHLPTTGPSPHNSPYTTYGNNSQCSLAVPPGSPLGRPRGAAEVDEFSPSIQNSPRRGLSGRGGVSGTPEPSAVYSRTYSNRHVNTNSFDFAGPGDHGGDPLGSTVGSMHLHPPLQPFRVCSACYYEVQLAVPTRQEDGTLRRKSRGELKMFHRSLLVHILSYLTLPDLREVALVSADFYFMSRDNVIWYGYNMTRWAKDKDLPQPLALARGGAGVGASANRRAAMNAPSFQAAAVLNDATALSESEAAKRVISLHARYSFSQFLDFARRMEMARCEGLSSFTLGARILLSNPIKIAIVGPSRVGKTASIRSFLGEEPSTMVVHPTAGFCRYDKTVKVVGGLMADVTFHLYDLSGESRYEELRRFICSQCHAIGLCYDPQKKLTLVQAADIMMGIEPSLGPQPVVVCGLIRNTTAPVAEVTPPHESPSRAESVPRISSLHLAKEGNMEFNAADDDDDVGDGESASGAVDGGAEGGESPPLAPSFTDLPNDSERGLPAVEEPSPGVDVSSPSYSSTSRRARNGAVGGAFSPPGMPPLEVSEQDAEDITVRGGGSLQCSLFHSDAFYAQLLQALLTRLAMATMGCTAMTMSAMTEEGRRETDPRGYRVDQAVAQELLAITMEPCALDVLLN